MARCDHESAPGDIAHPVYIAYYAAIDIINNYYDNSCRYYMIPIKHTEVAAAAAAAGSHREHVLIKQRGMILVTITVVSCNTPRRIDIIIPINSTPDHLSHKRGCSTRPVCGHCNRPTQRYPHRRQSIAMIAKPPTSFRQSPHPKNSNKYGSAHRSAGRVGRMTTSN